MSRSEASPPDLVNPLPRVRWVPLVLLMVLLGAAVATGLHSFASLDTIVELRDRFHSEILAHRLLTMVIYFAAYVALVAMSLPGSILLTVTAGLMFGWLTGGILAVLAATAGATIVFVVARMAVGEQLTARAGAQIGKLKDGFCRDAFSYMLFLRLVPAFPFVAVNVVPALLGVPFRTFVLGTFVGIMPACFAYSSAGAGLDSTIHAAKLAQARCLASTIGADCPLGWKMASLMTPELKMALVLLSVLALLPVGIKVWRRRHGK